MSFFTANPMQTITSQDPVVPLLVRRGPRGCPFHGSWHSIAKCLSVSAVSLVIAPTMAFAQVFFTSGSVQTPDGYSNQESPDMVILNRAYAVPYGSSTANVFAEANPGILRVLASVFATSSSEDSTWANASAFAQFRDTITISAAGLDGQRGSAVVSIYLPGTILGDQTGGGSFRGDVVARFDLGRTRVYTLTEQSGGGPPLPPPYIPDDGHILLPLSFTYGAPLGISVSLEAVTEVNAYESYNEIGSMRVEADFAHSLIWDGISGVSVGNVLLDPDGFSITSTSGTDYSMSYVPEPEQYAIAIAISMAGLAFTRRSMLRSKRESVGA
jgi:hypothetical protein